MFQSVIDTVGLSTLLSALSFGITRIQQSIVTMFGALIVSGVSLNRLMQDKVCMVWFIIFDMGLVVTKPVFGASDKARLKPVSSISLVAKLDMILTSMRKTKALTFCADAQAGLRLCCSQTLKTDFLTTRPMSRENLTMLHAKNKGLDQPVIVCSLISAFIIRSLESKMMVGSTM